MKQLNQWAIVWGGKSKTELLALLKQHQIGLNAYAKQLLSELVFTNEARQIQLIETSVLDLGFSSGALFSDIVESALNSGLSLCPLELAPYFRLHYLTQEGPDLTIASPKFSQDDNDPNGFYLRYLDGIYWLRGYRASDDWLYSAEKRFAFIQN